MLSFLLKDSSLVWVGGWVAFRSKGFLGGSYVLMFQSGWTIVLDFCCTGICVRFCTKGSAFSFSFPRLTFRSKGNIIWTQIDVSGIFF